MTDKTIDQKAIAENVRRTVQHVALRKVRALVDDLQEEDRHQHLLQRFLLAGALAALLVWGGLLISHKTGQQERDRLEEARYACETRLYREYLVEYQLYLESVRPASSPEERRAALRAREPYVLKQVLAECRKIAAKPP